MNRGPNTFQEYWGIRGVVPCTRGWNDSQCRARSMHKHESAWNICRRNEKIIYRRVLWPKCELLSNRRKDKYHYIFLREIKRSDLIEILIFLSCIDNLSLSRLYSRARSEKMKGVKRVQNDGFCIFNSCYLLF